MPNREDNPPKFGHRYPWDEWFGRGRFVLHRGVDFDCEPISMATMVRQQMLARGLVMTVRIRGDVVDVGPKSDWRGRRRGKRMPAGRS